MKLCRCHLNDNSCEVHWNIVGIDKAMTSSEREISVFEIEVWNKAIEAATLIGYDDKQREEIRRLKK